MATVVKTIQIEHGITLANLIVQLNEVMDEHGDEALQWTIVMAGPHLPEGIQSALPFSPPNVDDTDDVSCIGYRQRKK